jgi:hypothetical protein
VVVVKKGTTTVANLEMILTAIFCKTKKWLWQIRELDPNSLLVRFPPWKKVHDLIEFLAFDLEAGSMTVKIVSWDMEVAVMSDLTQICLTVKGIPPKFCP